MKMLVSFTILGDPRPLALKRARAAHFAGRTRMYDPAANISAKEQVKHAALTALGGTSSAPTLGPIHLAVKAYIPIPKSFSKKKRAEALAGRLYSTSKPDLTNVVKLVEDALNEFIYKDDKQICWGTQSKRYSNRPRLWVGVYELGAGT